MFGFNELLTMWSTVKEKNEQISMKVLKYIAGDYQKDKEECMFDS